MCDHELSISGPIIWPCRNSTAAVAEIGITGSRTPKIGSSFPFGLSFQDAGIRILQEEVPMTDG